MLRCIPVARVIAKRSAFARPEPKNHGRVQVGPPGLTEPITPLKLVNLLGKRAPGPRKSQVDKMGGSRCSFFLGGNNMLNCMTASSVPLLAAFVIQNRVKNLV